MMATNKVIGKDGLPNLTALTFSKDSTNASNIAILPLLVTSDTSLNLKSCLLYVMFYPDRFFLTDKFLHFTIAAKEIIPKNRDKIKPAPIFR